MRAAPAHSKNPARWSISRSPTKNVLTGSSIFTSIRTWTVWRTTRVSRILCAVSVFSLQQSHASHRKVPFCEELLPLRPAPGAKPPKINLSDRQSAQSAPPTTIRSLSTESHMP